MNGLIFQVESPVVSPDPNRADIALFAGFVERRKTPLPPEVKRWLDQQGWTAGPYARPSFEDLLNLPVPIDTWEVFDRLFAWDHRPIDGDPRGGATYLGAAVRSFFAQGGRKCYVVRVGDPWPLVVDADRKLTVETRRAIRLDKIRKLIPGFELLQEEFAALAKAPPDEQDTLNDGDPPNPNDRTSWRGIGHLFGLLDVSFLCLPDLADAVGAEREQNPPEPIKQTIPEQFVECSAPQPAPPRDRIARFVEAPRCDDRGYEYWFRATAAAAALISGKRRDVQLIAALPILEPGSGAERGLLQFLMRGGAGPLAKPLAGVLGGVSSAFVQLVYPWVRTPGSTDLPEQLESPDGVLAGLLARNALMRGTFRSAAGHHLADVYEVAPLLSGEQMFEPSTLEVRPGVRPGLIERVSLLGPTPSGLQLLSDVTTSLDESYRPAAVNRLVSVIVRAARRIGEDAAFESSGEVLWAQLTEQMNALLSGLFSVGALNGATAAEAFQVRCDRSTMSQNDIDNGRVIVHVQFTAAAPIERITIVLAMDEGGQVSQVSGGLVNREAA